MSADPNVTAADIAEASLLGCALIEPQAATELARSLPAEAFKREAHRLVADAIIKLHRDGAPTDVRSVTVALIDAGQLDAVGGPAALTDLTSCVVPASWPHYARLVDREWQRRRLRLVLCRLVHDLDDGARPDVVLQALRDEVGA
ncbi:MAG: hypothetical protein JJT89_06595 [Nitriliruptoraceae bacterium]|nr:hypothetical protein [Nitriliruptoraceae bacterium]